MARSEPSGPRPRLELVPGAAGERTPAELNRFVRIAHDLATSLDPKATGKLAARGLADLVGAAFAASYTAEGDDLDLTAVAGLARAGALRGPPAIVRRAASLTGVAAADPGELEELRRLGLTCEGALAAACIAESTLQGVLFVGLTAGSNAETEAALVGTVADLTAASLAHGRRFALTFAEAREDSLTGVPNNRAFEEDLEAILRDALAHDRQATLVLFDLDDFKAINDARGHPTGNEVLSTVAQITRASLRTGEAVFRVGGDEFGVVVDGDANAATVAVARVRAALARTERVEGLPTLSAGIASFPADARTRDELVRKADRALYAAKRSGKDQAVHYSEQLEQHHWAPERVEPRQVAIVAPVAEALRVIGLQPAQRPMLEEAARQLAAVLGATACEISRLDGQILRTAAQHYPPPWSCTDESFGYLLSDYPLTQTVLERLEPRAVSLLDDAPDPSEAYLLHDSKLGAVLMLPVDIAGTAWGLVEIFDARPRRFSPEDIAVAQLVVAHAGVLLERFRGAEGAERTYQETLAALANVLEAKDGYTSYHTQEVASLATRVAARLGLSDDERRIVELGSLLHDIGKVRIPESILSKPGPLTEDEWELMRTHPVAGERILAPIGSLQDVLPVVRSSHERWDGGGYPDGLAGERIPLGARVVAVCDALRAMVESRPYRRALPLTSALDELRRNAGSQFDPSCVQAVIDVVGEQSAPQLYLHRPD